MEDDDCRGNETWMMMKLGCHHFGNETWIEDNNCHSTTVVGLQS